MSRHIEILDEEIARVVREVGSASDYVTKAFLVGSHASLLVVRRRYEAEGLILSTRSERS